MKKIYVVAEGIFLFLVFSTAFFVFIAMMDKGHSDGSVIELNIGSLLIWLLALGIILFLAGKWIEILKVE